MQRALTGWEQEPGQELEDCSQLETPKHKLWQARADRPLRIVMAQGPAEALSDCHIKGAWPLLLSSLLLKHPLHPTVLPSADLTVSPWAAASTSIFWVALIKHLTLKEIG